MQEITRGKMERRWLKEGHLILGVDEVGRGCLAGPVFAASAQLDYQAVKKLSTKDKDLLRDSKTLSHLQRERAITFIKAVAKHWEIGRAEVNEIEVHGIVGATFLAMRRAITPILPHSTLLIVDGNAKIPNIDIRQESIVKGDNLCYAIAAASILAKEARDSFMREIALEYPGYGFEKHVGYGTREHLAALHKQGICPLHRKNFAPIQELLN